MRLNLKSRFAVAALMGLTALPIVAHADDKMMSKDKMSSGTMMSKDKMMSDKSGMTMKQKKMMKQDAMGMTSMQKKGMMKNMMMSKAMMKREMNRIAWYKKEYGSKWRKHYMPVS